MVGRSQNGRKAVECLVGNSEVYLSGSLCLIVCMKSSLPLSLAVALIAFLNINITCIYRTFLFLKCISPRPEISQTLQVMLQPGQSHGRLNVKTRLFTTIVIVIHFTLLNKLNVFIHCCKSTTYTGTAFTGGSFYIRAAE